MFVHAFTYVAFTLILRCVVGPVYVVVVVLRVLVGHAPVLFGCTVTHTQVTGARWTHHAHTLVTVTHTTHGYWISTHTRTARTFTLRLVALPVTTFNAHAVVYTRLVTHTRLDWLRFTRLRLRTA